MAKVIKFCGNLYTLVGLFLSTKYNGAGAGTAPVPVWSEKSWKAGRAHPRPLLISCLVTGTLQVPGVVSSPPTTRIKN